MTEEPAPSPSRRSFRGAAVGCVGWSIPRRYQDLFGDGESVLARYATRFPVVEVNSSFYRPHRPATYRRWAAAVPAHFRFSVKVPRTISHEHGLRAAAAPLERFLAEAGCLDDKLGGYLLQLPPRLAFDARVASAFFRMFRQRSDAPLACEARHPSWFCGKADALFERHAVGRVVADPPIAAAAGAAVPGTAWRYRRWHGSPRMYYSAYTEEDLRQLASAVLREQAPHTRAWVVFDNTAHGLAIPNAVRLQALLADAARG